MDCDLIKIILANVGTLGIFGYFFKRQLEKFKSKITKENTKYSIQQKINIEKTYGLYDELKSILNELDKSLQRVCLNIKSDSTFLEESKEAYCNKFLEFNNLLYENEILLKEDTLIDIKKEYTLFFEIFNDSNENQIKEILPNTIDEISRFTRERRKRIIEIFRDLLGIE